MSEDEKQKIETDFVTIIQETISNANLGRYERKKKVWRSWERIILDDNRFDRQREEESIRQYLPIVLNRMIEQHLKDGKSTPPELHDNTLFGYGTPNWRDQFIVSSADGDYHVLVTMESDTIVLEITFEIEVE